MFSQPADQPPADDSPAPDGMRELPPQPAKPVMPTYTTQAAPVGEETGPGPDDSVIAKDDHLEGTFTSRGTVVVMGSVKGRIEAVQVRIEDGAKVDADVIVDEAIIAGEFTGNLTCRDRLEARASGRINGRVETYKLMLHEGASVEGEMHMLTESPRDASETIRGTAPVRGEVAEATRMGRPASGASESKAAGATASAATSGPPATSVPPATRPAPTVTPTSSAKPSPSATGSTPGAATTAPRIDASTQRQSVAEALRSETLRVAPRTSSVPRYSPPTRTGSSNSRERSGKTPTGL